MKIKLSELVHDDALRARMGVDPIAVHRLVQAYQAGARFPPLIIEAGTNRLVDGWHREAAYLRLEVEVANAKANTYASEAELFADAIRLNISHGEPLTSYDLKHAIARLADLGIGREAISEIVRIPVPRIEDMVRGFGRGVGSEVVPLKHGLEHLAGQRLTSQQVGAIRRYGGNSATFYARQLVMLLEQDVWPRNQPNFAEAMTQLSQRWLAIVTKDAAA